MIKFNLIVSLLILPIMATDIAAQARFTPKELPYAYDALAPQVSEETGKKTESVPIFVTYLIKNEKRCQETLYSPFFFCFFAL